MTLENVELRDAIIKVCEITDDPEASHDLVAEIVTGDEGELNDVADIGNEGVCTPVSVRVAVMEDDGVSLSMSNEDETTGDGETELETDDGADTDELRVL